MGEGGCGARGPAHGLCSEGLKFRGQNRPCRGRHYIAGGEHRMHHGAAEAGGETGAFQCFGDCSHHRAIVTGKPDSLLDVSESASLLEAAVWGLWGDSSFASVFLFFAGRGHWL